jgi:hypothetical protein
LKSRLPRIAGASATMAGAVWAADRWVVPELPLHALGGDLPAIATLAVLLAVGGISFVAAAFGLGATSITDIKSMIRPRRAPETPAGSAENG